MADTARDEFEQAITIRLCVRQAHGRVNGRCVEPRCLHHVQAADLAAAVLDGPSPPALLVEDLAARERAALQAIRDGGGEPITEEMLAWHDRGYAKAIDELRPIVSDVLAGRLCNVCTGNSPRSDGHDRKPRCQAAALADLQSMASLPEHVRTTP